MTHRASHAVEPAPGVEEALGAVAGDGGTGAGDLLVHPGVMLNTSGDVSPGPVLLKCIANILSQVQIMAFDTTHLTKVKKSCYELVV